MATFSEPSYRGSRAITPGTPVTPGRGFRINATVAGNVEFTFKDPTTGATTTDIVIVSTGTSVWPYSVSNVTSGGNTTATATYAALD